MTRWASLPERLWTRVESTPFGCWIWTGHVDRQGYGRIRVAGGPPRLVHRTAYELMVGPIPDGLVIDHLCRNRGCVNPSHLEPVTSAENIRRGTGASVRHAAQTHCVNGHEFTPKNTWLEGGVKRRCKECWRDRRARRNKVVTDVSPHGPAPAQSASVTLIVAGGSTCEGEPGHRSAEPCCSPAAHFAGAPFVASLLDKPSGAPAHLRSDPRPAAAQAQVAAQKAARSS